MAKSKAKRYAAGDAVYEDDTPEEVANRSEDSQAIANEAKGDTMLKAMRDETAAEPKVMAKPRVAAPVVKSAAPAAKPTAPAASATKAPAKNENYSNEGRYKAALAKTAAKVGRAGQAVAEAKEKHPLTNETLSAAREKWSKESASERPSALSRFLSDFSGSQRSRKYSKAEGMASGGMASSASRRADGIATKGKTRGKIC